MDSDCYEVMGAMRAFPNFSIREWAANLGWKYPASGKPDQDRIHKALLELAVSGKAQQVEGKWRLI